MADIWALSAERETAHVSPYQRSAVPGLTACSDLAGQPFTISNSEGAQAGSSSEEVIVISA